MCSEHFKPEDFFRKFTTLSGQEKTYVPWLKTDELGIIPFPSVFKKGDHKEELPVRAFLSVLVTSDQYIFTKTSFFFFFKWRSV